MGVITALEIGKRSKKRVNVQIDGAYAFALSLDDAARLRKGQELSEHEIAALQATDAEQRATDVAARLLSLRPRSVSEVRQHLLRKQIAPAVADAAIVRLQMMGYLDDHAFAQYWIQGRGSTKPLSARALRHELRQKGIARAIIDELLADQDEQESAEQAARSQLARLRGKDRAQARQRLMGMLARRGFSSSTSREAVRRLFDVLDEEDPHFFASRDGLDDEPEFD